MSNEPLSSTDLSFLWIAANSSKSAYLVPCYHMLCGYSALNCTSEPYFSFVLIFILVAYISNVFYYKISPPNKILIIFSEQLIS